MKNRYLSISLLLAAALSSCHFLDEQPRSALTEEQVYSTLDDLRHNAVLSIYQYIGGSADSEGLQGTGRGVYDLNSLTTDEQIIPTRGGDWYDGGYWQRLYLHQWDATDISIRDTWNYLYKVIMLSTKGIEAVEHYDKSDASTTELQAYTAELRALRAMYYFYLTDLFGNIAIVDSSTVQVSDIKLTERAEVYQYIISELASAMPYLSKSKSNEQLSDYYGRMTYHTAAFLMMKLAINISVYSPNKSIDIPVVQADGSTNYESAYQSVCSYCDILSATYELENNLTDNFALNNEQSKENIFVIPRDISLYRNRYNYTHRSLHYNHASALGIGGENGASATKATLQVFGYGTEQQDPRFDMYFYYDTVKVNGNIVLSEDGVSPLVYIPQAVDIDISNTEYEKNAGARIRKYEHDPNGLFDATVARNDIVLFRYADALLMKAEALVRLGSSGKAEYDMVRKRVDLSASASEPTLQDIYEERWRELMWEGWHRNDMIRFGKYSSDHTAVFPIPQSLCIMHPDWQQNKGY